MHVIYFCPVDNIEREDMSDYDPEYLKSYLSPGTLYQHRAKNLGLLKYPRTLYDRSHSWGYEAGNRFDWLALESHADFLNLVGLPITEDSIKGFLKAYMLAMAFQRPGSYLPAPALEKLFEDHIGETFYIWF